MEDKKGKTEVSGARLIFAPLIQLINGLSFSISQTKYTYITPSQGPERHKPIKLEKFKRISKSLFQEDNKENHTTQVNPIIPANNKTTSTNVNLLPAYSTSLSHFAPRASNPPQKRFAYFCSFLSLVGNSQAYTFFLAVML